MHAIAIFGILLLISLRVVGLIIAIEFLRDLKESKFKILIIGWFIWILAGCSALLSGVYENQLFSDIFLLINGITTSIAGLFVMMGLFSYFQELPGKILAILSILFISVPLISFLLGFYNIASNLSSMFLFLIIVVFSIVPLRRKETFKNNISIKSYYWYLIVLLAFYSLTISYVIFIFQGYSFGFYSDEFSIPMFVNYFLGNASTIALIIYSIHIEYDISKIQKFKLTDKYSHDLGNLIQVISSAAILTNVNKDLKKEKVENLDLIQKKCEEAAKLIKDIRKNQ
ncbi:MAG: hypothetical protein E3J90_01255 [Promethearchaeota archaeon]|nr:MAG: hypothetical protein E3J90_01255 [Candidatus Lokiarchaeota archaeon]